MTLARDVAKELAKRSRRRKVLFVAVVAGLIALAVTYLHCGMGWGFGGGRGSGTGTGTGTGTGSEVVRRCVLRLDAHGLSLDGKPATQAEALAACRKAGRADVIVVGDAREGAWDSLRQALDEAGVPHGAP